MKQHDDRLTTISIRVLPRITEAVRRRAVRQAAHTGRPVTLGEVARDLLSAGLDLTEVPRGRDEAVARGDLAGAERTIRAIVAEELDGNWRFRDPFGTADQLSGRVLEALGFGDGEEDRAWLFTVLLLSGSILLDRLRRRFHGRASRGGRLSDPGDLLEELRRRLRERTEPEDDFLPDMERANGQERSWWPEG